MRAGNLATVCGHEAVIMLYFPEQLALLGIVANLEPMHALAISVCRTFIDRDRLA